MGKRWLIILALFFTACSSQDITWQPIELNTAYDDITIVGDFYVADSDKGVILLHMLDGSREDWRDFAQNLQSSGYNVLAIDLRGHGGSYGDWHDFNEDQFNHMTLDVDAARKALGKFGVSRIGIIGASLGANVAVKYAAGQPSIKTIVLLSPGLDYKGVETGDAIAKYEGPVFIAASKGDTQSYDGSNELYSKVPGKKQLQVYEGSNHGTDMLSKESSLDDLIGIWLDSQMG